MINVLIVEDDFRVADIHERYLKTIPSINDVYKVNLAKDAIHVIEQEDIELVLVDIYMPDQLGIDLISDLKKKYPHLNFIIITAAKDTDLLEESLRIGVFYYLIKPVTLEKFEEVIGRYEERQKMIDSNQELDQNIVDNILRQGGTGDDEIESSDLPKGIHAITLNNILEVVKESSDGLTVDDVSKLLGTSRTTARRYLEYLVSIRRMKSDVEYGIVGRPQRIYIYIK